MTDCLLHLFFFPLQPQYSYVDGDGTVPSESAKVCYLTILVLFSIRLKERLFRYMRIVWY